ncbi:hypothetical protein MKS88_002175 [Plasmodium brasilianum]|uniref:Uncharacterized protein n=1 Tax=Plasmodium brasilianum TaxID=5824 RepID=A0ACB9YCL4_PLABR|nr:hypothetical protein MKS88_002175 [Plasmodium brasilianum]
MEKNISMFLVINIAVFNFLIRICYLSNYMGTFNKSLEMKHNVARKLSLKTCRLLAKCMQDKDSNILGLKNGISNNAGNAKKNIYYNEEWVETKIKYSNTGSSKNTKVHKQAMKNNYNIFETKKYSQLEKKIFKELDYLDFLKNNRTISNKVYEKVARKKYRLRICVPIILLILLSILIILDSFFSCGLKSMFIKIVTLCHGRGWYGPLHNYLKSSNFSWLFKSVKEVIYMKEQKTVGGELSDVKGYVYAESFLGYLVYIMPLIILGVTVILGILYYHKKVKKYQKIKFRK